MQNEKFAISNSNDLQQQIVVLQQSIRMLLEYQNELGFQIKKLTNVNIKDIINDVIMELNNTEETNISSFEDLLILNAKMTLRKAI